MIEKSTIETVKRVPITVYLQSKGVFPAHKLDSAKNDYAYCSPLSNEHTPSFFVNEADNVFHDFSTGEKGDVIRLVRQLERVDFISAVRRLETFTGFSEPLQFATYEIATERKRESDCEIVNIKTLQHPALIEYVERERKIPYAYAASHLRQIHYRRKSKRFFGAGFRNDNGGWAVRTGGFKTHIGNVGITTISVADSTTVNVFEGFFNYLSALVWFGKHAASNTTIVLNSTSNLALALPTLVQADLVVCYLDNDKAGRRTLDKIGQAGCKVADRSHLYSAYNDFNDFLRTR